ncbi:MAG TPA: hypothetical protein VEQ65_11810 [Opitutus sp.]|nr:hypothetical protein [Opitutus sp.]
MQPDLLAALRVRQLQIRAHWVELLRLEPVNTPLAHPEALAHLIDWTLSEIFQGLSGGTTRRRPAPHANAALKTLCACGRNPLLAYFDAAGQVLREALVLVQATAPHLDPLERDASLEELNLVLNHVARREIEAFCGVCQHRDKSIQCPTRLASAADHTAAH